MIGLNAEEYDVLLADCQGSILLEKYNIPVVDIYVLSLSADSVRAVTGFPAIRPIDDSEFVDHTTGESAPEPIHTAASSTHVNSDMQVHADTLNVRSGPATTFPVVAQISAGDMLAVSDRNEDASWLQVCCFNDQQGWVINNSDYVSLAFDVDELEVSKAPRVCPVDEN